MKLSLTLNYTLPEGALAPYFDALRDGIALASRCDSCGWVSFPARVRCVDCRAEGYSWTKLNGQAWVIFRTDGSTASYALVRFDGADGAATVALCNPAEKNETGRLIAPDGDRPGLWVLLDKKEAGDV